MSPPAKAHPESTEPCDRGIVLAYQGGGSNTAFTAGVLRELLRHDDLDILRAEARHRRPTDFWNRLTPRGLLDILGADPIINGPRSAWPSTPRSYERLRQKTQATAAQV